MPPRADPIPSIGLTDLDVVALTLHHEAALEGLRGMTAVAFVIKNRVTWGRWGDARGVCLAYKQFSCWRAAGGIRNFNRLTDHAEAIRDGTRPAVMERAYGLATALLNGSLTGPDPSIGADHYYAPISMNPPSTAPVWAKGEQPTAIINRHIFYRLRPTTGATT